MKLVIVGPIYLVLKLAAVVLTCLMLSGCAPLLALQIYEQQQYSKAVKRGEVPSPEVVRQCNQDGLARDASGRWVQDPQLTETCYRDHGWITDSTAPQGWSKVQP